MKILVSLSSYGDKNLHLLDSVIDEYRSYKKYNITIEVHCTVPLPRTDITQIIHKDPLTTSLFHRKDFIREKSNYDLFLFSEYDMLIKEAVIDTYLKYDKALPIDTCLGFIRYENTPEDIKYLIDLWLNIPGYSYIKNNKVMVNDKQYFTLTNVHQACYLLTREKLQYIISNTQYDFDNLNGLGVETSSSGIFRDWEYGPTGIIQKVLPLDVIDLRNCFIHHMPDCHCNTPGVNATPEVFRSNTVTLNKLFEDLNLN